MNRFTPFLLLVACAAQEKSVSVPVAIAGVIPEGQQGASIALLDPKRSLVVEVHVGGSEATSIEHRWQHTNYVRPLTHDLMDATFKQTGIDVVRAQIDKLEGGTFYGTLVLKQKTRYFEMDARPSDAIALALGNGVPIYCATAVIEHAGVPRSEIDLP